MEDGMNIRPQATAKEMAQLATKNRKITIDTPIFLKAKTRIITPVYGKKTGFFSCDCYQDKIDLKFWPVEIHSKVTAPHPNLGGMPMYDDFKRVAMQVFDTDADLYFVVKTTRAHLQKGVYGFRAAVREGLAMAVYDDLKSEFKIRAVHDDLKFQITRIPCDAGSAKAAMLIAPKQWQKVVMPYLMEKHNIPRDMLMSGEDTKGKYKTKVGNTVYYVDTPDNEDDEPVDYTSSIPAKGLQIWFEMKFGEIDIPDKIYLKANIWLQIYNALCFVWYGMQVASGLRMYIEPYRKEAWNLKTKLIMRKKMEEKRNGRNTNKPVDSSVL